MLNPSRHLRRALILERQGRAQLAEDALTHAALEETLILAGGQQACTMIRITQQSGLAKPQKTYATGQKAQIFLALTGRRLAASRKDAAFKIPSSFGRFYFLSSSGELREGITLRRSIALRGKALQAILARAQPPSLCPGSSSKPKAEKKLTPESLASLLGLSP